VPAVLFAVLQRRSADLNGADARVAPKCLVGSDCARVGRLAPPRDFRCITLHFALFSCQWSYDPARHSGSPPIAKEGIAAERYDAHPTRYTRCALAAVVRHRQAAAHPDRLKGRPTLQAGGPFWSFQRIAQDCAHQRGLAPPNRLAKAAKLHPFWPGLCRKRRGPDRGWLHRPAGARRHKAPSLRTMRQPRPPPPEPLQWCGAAHPRRRNVIMPGPHRRTARVDGRVAFHHGA